MFSIILYKPEIPQNTGSIGRLCVLNDVRLRLVRPFSFSLSDKYLHRAGLDYWKYLNLDVIEEDIFVNELESNTRVFFFSTKGKIDYWDADFRIGDSFVFGPETSGLPTELLERFSDRALKIPMYSDKSRSINLSTSVGIVLYEALRQVRFESKN